MVVMNSYEFNLRQLELVAAALGGLLSKVTFVGGCTTALLVDEAGYSGVRQTKDVDVIVDLENRDVAHFQFDSFCQFGCLYVKLL